MTHRQARCAFTAAVVELILYALSLGYEVAMDEGMERLTIQDPTSDHRKNSLHHLGLALDLLLYLNGIYLTKTEDYERLGLFWEELGIKKGLPLAWGGRFKDGNHFSLGWNGFK